MIARVQVETSVSLDLANLNAPTAATADRQRSLIPGLFVRMFTGKNGLATEASSTVLAT